MSKPPEVLVQLTLHYVRRHSKRAKSLGSVDPSRDPIPAGVIRQLNRGKWYTKPRLRLYGFQAKGQSVSRGLKALSPKRH